jgi:hypothetical protein
MRLFVTQWIALVAAIFASLIAYQAFQITSSTAGLGFNPSGNLAFSVVLALGVFHDRTMKFVSVKTLIGIAAFIVSCVAVVLLAVVVWPHARTLGSLMTAPVGAIGSYPTGPDVPLPDGAFAWGLSILVPIALGFLESSLFRSFGRHEATEAHQQAFTIQAHRASPMRAIPLSRTTVVIVLALIAAVIGLAMWKHSETQAELNEPVTNIG